MVAAVTGFPARSRRRPHGGPAVSRRYERRRPEKTPLHKIISENLESWLEWREAAERPVPGYVEDELRGYLQRGLLCFGFARAVCMAWSNSRRLSSSTGSPISCRRRGSIGIATTGCLRPITGCEKPSRHSRSATSASNARPRPVGMGTTVARRGAAATQIRVTSHARTTPHGNAWAKLMARVGEEFPLECPNCGGDIRREKTAGRSRLTSNRRFASGRRPGWLRPREVRSSHTSASHSSRLPSLPLVAHPPTGANSCRSMTIATSFRRRPTS